MKGELVLMNHCHIFAKTDVLNFKLLLIQVFILENITQLSKFSWYVISYQRCTLIKLITRSISRYQLGFIGQQPNKHDHSVNNHQQDHPEIWFPFMCAHLFGQINHMVLNQMGHRSEKILWTKCFLWTSQKYHSVKYFSSLLLCGRKSSLLNYCYQLLPTDHSSSYEGFTYTVTGMVLEVVLDGACFQQKSTKEPE